ncbi:MAG: dihydropteroate synthase, partial [Planctomycetes bacterium]|nr:dihydropteroate synthase [Planctomycetota bacterium]
VAALMSPAWIQRHIQLPEGTSRILLPGYVAGDLGALAEQLQRPVVRGPHDLRRLPEFFGRQAADLLDRGKYSIEILAEINHAPRLDPAQLLQQARQLVADGADVIDVGCEPGEAWMAVGDCVKSLRDEGFRVSIDSLNPVEIGLAVKAGAELVLSVNSSNRHAAVDWGCEVVAIPDNLAILDSLDETVDMLSKNNVPVRADPILEPVGFGFSVSLWRFMDFRRRHPGVPMLMGVANLTEMTDADSAAINLMLLGICQELGVQSVLTTQVINWARTSVRECDLARRFVYCAVLNKIPLKRIASDLVVLRDDKLRPFGNEQLDEMARQIRDHNVRIFAERGELHVLRAGRHLANSDPFTLFEELRQQDGKTLDASHAFYLGYEMALARTALTLDKEYRQDEHLDWGYLTEKPSPQDEHRLRR